jgi:hypothetical protein
MMRTLRHPAALLLALALATSFTPRATLAQTASDPLAGAAAGLDDSTDPNSVVGALAAAGCGFFVRATLVTGGTQVGTIAGAVACCLYMAFDAMVT